MSPYGRNRSANAVRVPGETVSEPFRRTRAELKLSPARSSSEMRVVQRSYAKFGAAEMVP